MRNDQIAVLLRDFAGRCIEWAAVLDKEKDDATDADFRAIVQRNITALQSPGPSSNEAHSVPTVSGDTPPPTDGGVLSQDVGQGVIKEGRVKDRRALWRDMWEPWQDPRETRLGMEHHTLPDHVYARLIIWASEFKPSAIYRDSRGRLLLSKYIAWTDAELTEAVR